MALLRSRGECRNENCLSERTDWVEKDLELRSRCPPQPPLVLTSDGDLDSMRTTHVCKQCLKLHHNEVAKIRERAWEKLPWAFGLGSWAELQRKMDSIYNDSARIS